MGFWRKWRFQSAVKRRANRQVRRGLMTADQAAHINKVLSFEMAGAVFQSVHTVSGEREFPILEAIWDWVVENWDEILRVIFTLAPLII